MRAALTRLTAGLFLAGTAAMPSAWAADASFVFYNDVEYPVSISLNNESKCTMAAATLPPSGESCTVNFDGSTSNTFDFFVSNVGYHETFTFNPGMPLNETCNLFNVNKHNSQMVSCGDVGTSDPMDDPAYSY